MNEGLLSALFLLCIVVKYELAMFTILFPSCKDLKPGGYHPQNGHYARETGLLEAACSLGFAVLASIDVRLLGRLLTKAISDGLVLPYGRRHRWRCLQRTASPDYSCHNCFARTVYYGCCLKMSCSTLEWHWSVQR